MSLRRDTHYTSDGSHNRNHHWFGLWWCIAEFQLDHTFAQVGDLYFVETISS